MPRLRNVGLAVIVVGFGLPMAWANAQTSAAEGTSNTAPSEAAQETMRVPILAPAPAVITGVWHGWYFYSDGQSSVPFSFQFDDSAGACSGRSEEPSTFGDKNSCGQHLTASLSCDSLRLVPGREVSIRKRYDPKCGGVSHAVRYLGTVSPDFQLITGHWTIGDQQGFFVMRR